MSVSDYSKPWGKEKGSLISAFKGGCHDQIKSQKEESPKIKKNKKHERKNLLNPVCIPDDL